MKILDLIHGYDRATETFFGAQDAHQRAFDRLVAALQDSGPVNLGGIVYRAFQRDGRIELSMSRPFDAGSYCSAEDVSVAGGDGAIGGR